MTRTPILDAWDAERRRGERTTHVFDPLWRAACLEARAAEAESDGLPTTAASDRREAARILRAGAKASAA